MPIIETATDERARVKGAKHVASTFRSIYGEIGAPVVGKISVARIQNDFSNLAQFASDSDARPHVNTAIQSCFSVVEKPPVDRADLATTLNPLHRLQEQLEASGQRSRTLQLVIDTVDKLSHRPEADSIMRAQVASLALVQALGEFGVALPHPLNPGDELLAELLKSNDKAARESAQKNGKAIPGAKNVHEKLKETDLVYQMDPARAYGGTARVTEDRKAIEVSVPTTTSPYVEHTTETGAIKYRYHLVTQDEVGDWSAVEMNEPVNTTEFDPQRHHITQTLSFWPTLPNRVSRYGIVIEQEGDWTVTQHKKTGKSKARTSFANPEDEQRFLGVMGDAVEELFYESSFDPDALTPHSSKVGKLYSFFKENGLEDLLAVPMTTVNRFVTDKTDSNVAFCARVGGINTPGELIPLGLSYNERAGAAGELMYTPDTLAEIRKSDYDDKAERLKILHSLGLDIKDNSRFEFFLGSATAVYEGQSSLDGRTRTRHFTRSLNFKPFTPEESAEVGADSAVNLIELVPVVSNHRSEGHVTEPKEGMETLGQVLAYYAALDVLQLGDVNWECPSVAARIKEIQAARNEAMERFRDRFDFGGMRGGGLMFGGMRGGGLKGGGFGVAGSFFGETRDAGRRSIGSASGVPLQLDPVHIRLIYQS